LPRRLFLLPQQIVVFPKRHFEARLIARDTSMTTRSTRRAGPLALACAWLACACLADAVPARAAPAATPAAVAASAPASEAAVSAATQYTVKPGQSLADIAIAATQSHDKNVVGRASKAIFDANPSAFMRGDPSLLKLGAVLNLPPLDATGAVVKAQAAPAASAPNATSGAAAASAGEASPKASGAQAAKPASTPTSAAVPALASAAASASASASAAASGPALAKPGMPAAGNAHQQPGVPAGASGAHAWAGAIEPAPAAPASEAASGAEASAAVPASGAASNPAAAGESASGASGAAAGSGAAVASSPRAGASAPGVAASAAAASHPKVSSLQQLLTLKNRVLMELQRHGFGAPSGSRSGSAGNAPAGASAPGFMAPPPASGFAAPAPGQSRQAAAANQRFIGIGSYGFNVARNDVPAIAAVMAAVCAALLVLLIALGISRRKRRTLPALAATAASNRAARTEREEADRPAAPLATAAEDPLEAEFLAILARNPSSKRALMGLAAHYAERNNVRGFDEIAQRIYRLSSGRGPNWVHIAALGRQLDPDNPLFALQADEANDDILSGASETELPTQLQNESAAESIASEQPPLERPEPPIEHPTARAVPELTDVVPPEAPAAEAPASGEPLPEAPADHAHRTDESTPPVSVNEESDEFRSGSALGSEAATESRAETTLPPEAIAALGALDMGLPPRVEDGAGRRQAAEDEPRQAREPEYERERDDEHVHGHGHEADDVPAAHTEPQAVAASADAAHQPTPIEPPPARPAVSGLGAAPVGPLKLSFDLDLPGGEASEHEASAAEAALPQFTPEQLAKIARNKLDLASEYIALGDLGGARTLIHEVIESNDAATRDEAHALLATLAPLS
jgi:FimV-like protein